jgi:magnesium-transporting ATPase (P-type)
VTTSPPRARRLPGLDSAEAARRLAESGPNVLPTERPPGVGMALLRQFTHFFALLLWGAAALAVVAGMPQLGVAIVVVIVINGSFAFVQEYRADRAVDRLRDLLPASAVVRRDGQDISVPAAELVPGDLVLLEAGSSVSADMSAASAVGLAADESMLTGESVPRRLAEGDDLYAGTFIVEGTAEAMVTATGGHTRLASIASWPTPTPVAASPGRSSGSRR